MLVAQGKLAEALKSFKDGLAIGDRLAKADPNNAGWQRDLSVSYDKVGDVLVAQGNLAEALKPSRTVSQSHRLAKADPNNAGWQRDLSVSYNKVGDVLVAQGNLARSPEELQGRPRHRPSRQGRPQQRRMAARSSVSYEKVGDVLVAQGISPPTESLRGRARYHFDRLAKADPNNAGWQRDLSVS